MYMYSVRMRLMRLSSPLCWYDLRPSLSANSCLFTALISFVNARHCMCLAHWILCGGHVLWHELQEVQEINISKFAFALRCVGDAGRHSSRAFLVSAMLYIIYFLRHVFIFHYCNLTIAYMYNTMNAVSHRYGILTL